MTNTLATWLLGGALVASLAWNFRAQPAAPAGDGCSSCSASAVDCSAAIEALDLEPDQRLALERWSSTSCKQSAQSDSRAQDMARSLADGPAFAHAMTKKCLHQEWSMSIEQAIETEAEAQAICMRTQDFSRAYHAFVKKESPKFEGN